MCVCGGGVVRVRDDGDGDKRPVGTGVTDRPVDGLLGSAEAAGSDDQEVSRFRHLKEYGSRFSRLMDGRRDESEQDSGSSLK